MESQKANNHVMVRMTTELKERLESEAKNQSRPLANYIRAVLINHINTLDTPKKIAELK